MIEAVKEKKMKVRDFPLAGLFFILMAYVLTGILLLVLAFLLYRFQLSSQTVGAGVILIYLASTFLAGFLAGKKAKNRKWLWGLLMGAGYFVILAAVSLMTHSAGENGKFLPSLFLCVGGGMLGGMLS